MRTRRVAATLLLALTLAGCGDSSSSEAADDPTDDPTGPPATSATVESCPYLDAGQVSTALGAPVIETAGSMHACFFDPEGGAGASVMLSRVDVQIDPADYAAQTRALCQGEVSEVDAGDEAFACVMALGPQGQLYDGRVLVTVSVSGAVDDATGLEVAAALLPEVTIPAAS
jgi:hypothetical protein